MPISTDVVELEVTFAEWTTKKEPSDEPVNLKALQKAGELKILQRVKLTTLAGVRASLQLSEQVAVVSGRSVGRGGGPITNVTYHPVGTTLEATPRIVDGKVAVTVKLERSGIVQPEKPATGEPDGSDNAKFTSMRSEGTVLVKNGDTVRLNHSDQKDGDTTVGRLVFVTATLVK